MRTSSSKRYSAVPLEVVFLYWKMRYGLSDKLMINSAIRAGEFISSDEATQSFDAMLQWLAFHATKSPESPPSVMLAGGAHRMLTYFARSPDAYRDFCMKYVGYVVRRISLDAEQTPVVRDRGGITHMTDGLTVAFGTELCSILRNWSNTRALKNGTVKTISFVGETSEGDDPEEVQRLLWSYWTR